MAEQIQIDECNDEKLDAVDLSKAPGHWVLAQMGKQVLRPGGRELTQKLVSALKINSADDVVEIAPGLGFTAKLVLQHAPHSYVGLERDEKAAIQARSALKHPSQRVQIGDVLKSGLADGCASVVYGEAMLTMQSDVQKKRIVHEAARMLKPGGRYGIHELCLNPNNISDELKKEIQHELAQSIRVNARPLTIDEWRGLLSEAGLKVIAVQTNPMHLLKSMRMIADEGLLRTLKITFNVLRNPAALKRVLHMRSVFNRYATHLGAIALVAVKP